MLWLGSFSNLITVADKDQHSNMDDKVEEQQDTVLRTFSEKLQGEV